jgi:Uma2 family endonuclease
MDHPVEPEVHHGDDVLVPDLAGWRRDRVAAIPDDVGIRIVPTWVCEVLSPSTAKLDRSRKLAVYARAGVECAWLVDPLARTVEVRRRHDEHWLIAQVESDDAAVRLEPFAAIELTPTAWWADVGPPSVDERPTGPAAAAARCSSG